MCCHGFPHRSTDERPSSNLGTSAVGIAALAAFLGSLAPTVSGGRPDGAKLIDTVGTVTFGALAVAGFTGGHDVQQLLVTGIFVASRLRSQDPLVKLGLLRHTLVRPTGPRPLLLTAWPSPPSAPSYGR